MLCVWMKASPLTTGPARWEPVFAPLKFTAFDKFVERAYLEQSTMESRYGELENTLTTVEALFNESSGMGISDNVSAFFNASAKPKALGVL